MKILRLLINDIKRIVVADISPDGHMVQLTGKNGSGKTSCLDALWWAIEGARHIQAEPIRHGADSGKIVLALGDTHVEMTVTRTFTRKRDPETGEELKPTTTLKVEADSGARFQSGQAVMDALVGALTMDPLEFLRSKPQDQFKTLRQFVKGVDFDEIDRLNKADFDKRTDINRSAKQIRAQAAGITVPAGTSPERLDTAALVEELDQAGVHNTSIETRKARRDQAAADILRQDEIAAGYRANAADLRRQADEEDRKAAEHEASVADLRSKFAAAAPLPDPIDTAPIRQKIESAARINAAVDARVRRDDLEAQAAKLEAEAAALTKAIADRKEGVTEIIAASDMPVPGIAFGDEAVLLDGVPFEQASDAQQLRASIAIAMAMSPKLRVIRVRDGDRLDDDGLQILREMAETHDFQIWMEQIRGAGEAAIVFEDGTVKAHALQAAE